MSTRKRTKLFVDRKVQGALVARAARYWVLSLAAVGSLTTIGWLMFTPDGSNFADVWAQFAAALPILVVAICVSFIFLPVVLYDLIRISNKFVGPMLRLRRHMLDLAAGRDVQPIHFRDGDFWEDMANAFNAVIDRVRADQPTERSRES